MAPANPGSAGRPRDSASELKILPLKLSHSKSRRVYVIEEPFTDEFRGRELCRNWKAESLW